MFLWKASVLYTFPLVLGKCSFLPEYISSCEMRLKGNGKVVSESVLESIFQMLLNFSIITQVIIEILALSLAENGVIFRYNHLRRGDYSGRTNFQNSRLAFCQYI